MRAALCMLALPGQLCAWAESTRHGMQWAVDECGYESKQKDAICEAHRPYQTISEASFSLISTDSLGL